MTTPASSPRAPVAVAIVTWNSVEYVERCLASLGTLVRRPEEIVVVDNGSTDGTAARIEANHPDIDLVQTGANLGFCRSTNLGIARTRSPFVLVLNPDTHLDPRFLEELLPAFDDPRVGIGAGKLLRFDGRTLDSAGQMLGRSRQPIDRGYGAVDAGQYDHDGEVFGACGAAALYRREMLEAIADEGGAVFDDEFFAYYEDLDVAWRARKLGWKAVYRYRATGHHARGATVGDPRVRRRGFGLLARSPELRVHLFKNRHLTILRNDTLAGVARNFPFILSRDFLMLGVVATTSPSVLLALWRHRDLLRRALALRRRDEKRQRCSPSPGPRDHGSS